MKMMRSLWIVFCLSLILIVDISANAIIGIRCKDGLVLVSDNYYVNPSSSLVQVHTANNLYQIDNRHVMGFISQKQEGRAILRSLKKLILTHRILYKQELSIDSLAKYARLLIYHEYSKASIIIAGPCTDSMSSQIEALPTDKDYSLGAGGEKNFKLFQIAPGGSLFEQDFLSVGRTGNFFPLLFETLLAVKGIQETSISFRPLLDPFSIPKQQKSLPLTVDDALLILKESIRAIMRNDPHSGGKAPHFLVIK